MTTRRVPPTIISSSLLGCLVLFANPLQAAGTATGDMDAYLASGELSLTSDIPEVLATTRLRQPKSRVPGTTTIIEGELIRALGIMNLVEVFRLVPGMTVAAVGSNNPVTSYHGTVHYEQRRMQVLVDGRTSYRPNLADVDWNAMPVPLELIERIEVSRGPNAAAYGINAFLATINIITRSPRTPVVPKSGRFPAAGDTCAPLAPRAMRPATITGAWLTKSASLTVSTGSWTARWKRPSTTALT